MAKEDNLTPFKPGESGNPNGRPKGSKNLSTLLKKILEEDVEIKLNKGEKVVMPFKEAIVRKLIVKASAGDAKAIQEIFDRVEGKANQSLTITDNTIEWIEGDNTD